MGRGFASGLRCQAPSEGDQPFASSPFAHPIPQSRRRASGDLFRASLGSVPEKETAWGELIKQPDEIGGAETQSPYLVVADPDALYARAKAAGARIIVEIKDEDYGGRGFSCYDLEGHLWNFGSYDPW
jgi:uncharacterized glyoxalase superfamily protein PhnB